MCDIVLEHRPSVYRYVLPRQDNDAFRLLRHDCKISGRNELKLTALFEPTGTRQRGITFTTPRLIVGLEDEGQYLRLRLYCTLISCHGETTHAKWITNTWFGIKQTHDFSIRREFFFLFFFIKF